MVQWPFGAVWVYENSYWVNLSSDKVADKDVYKKPQLDLVGWFTLGPTTGPKLDHLPVHAQLTNDLGFESACLLMFHPEAPSSSGKLPLTLFEGVPTTTDAGSMDVDGADSPFKFRELAYSVETGEAEMISVDFVARGGGNAAAITQSKPPQKDLKDDKTKGKGKAQGGDAQVNGVESASYLTTEDEEIVTSLTAKANAIKMLHQRVALLHTYLSSLPPTYLSDASLPMTASTSSPLNHQILRSASALLARLPLLIPADTPAFERESLEE
ncbi:hypothetical protein LTS18_007019, partial [Coniosporium uncinatum]